MKKIYQKPELEVVAVEMMEMVAESATSVESTRNIGGGPTFDDGIKLPTAVGETDGIIDPFGSHGQGSGGSGNRAKGGLWDAWDD